MWDKVQIYFKVMSMLLNDAWSLEFCVAFWNVTFVLHVIFLKETSLDVVQHM